jgi:short-subunit dehydrogenase
LTASAASYSQVNDLKSYIDSRIDIIVNNAGYELVGPLEQTSMEEIKAIINIIMNIVEIL